MKKRIVILYAAVCVYELIKAFYSAFCFAQCAQNMLFCTYLSLAAVCVPVLLWFMLALNEQNFHWALYAQALFKFSAICAEFLYIFHEGFAIIARVFTSAQRSLNFTREVLFFLAVDTVLLFYSFMRGSVYYANNTDC